MADTKHFILPADATHIGDDHIGRNYLPAWELEASTETTTQLHKLYGSAVSIAKELRDAASQVGDNQYQSSQAKQDAVRKLKRAAEARLLDARVEFTKIGKTKPKVLEGRIVNVENEAARLADVALRSASRYVDAFGTGR